MADQGLWFKLWCAALDDPDLDNLDIADFGRWAKLGAFIKRQGNEGSITVKAPARALCAVLQVANFGEFEAAIARLPNVKIEKSMGEGDVKITFINWTRYQADPRAEKGSGYVKVNGFYVSRAEHEFKKILDDIGVEYERQKRFPYAKTFYTVDFYLPVQRIAFEINGPEHSTKKYKELDQRKKRTLSEDFQVVVHYIDNTSIVNNLEFTKRYVIECIESLSNASSPIRREEKRREEKRGEREEKPPIVPLSGDAPLHPPGSLNPTKEPAYSESFRSFWAQYPRKQGKDKAWEVWKRKQLDTQAPAIMQKLRQQKTWRQWALEGGRYIPNPSTYLSQGRWKDEEGPADAAPVTKTDVLADMMREAEEQEYGNGTRDHAVSSDAQRRLSGVAERPAAGTPAADIPRLRATPR